MTRFRLVQAFTFLGAFLIFALEPLAGRLLLPRYGGSFLTWATCLAFFQGALFFGYLYSHVLAPRLGRVHLVALLAPIALLPLDLGAEADLDHPVLSITRTLARRLALPFVALASTAVVAQRWVAASNLPEKDRPYQLYAVSNVGSLLALLAYPLAIEPVLGLETQRFAWTAGYVLYVALGFATAWATRGAIAREGSSDAPAAGGNLEPGRVAPARLVAWVFLSAAPSAFLVAVNNVLTIDVGAFPLLWVIPLALYLATFILAFRDPPWCPPLLRRYAFHLALTGVALHASGTLQQRSAAITAAAIGAHLVILFVASLVAHAELSRSKPEPRHLTTFYLAVAFGGWLGGLGATLLPPLVATSLVEYPASLALIGATVAIVRRREIVEWFRTEPLGIRAGTIVLALLASSLVVLAQPPALRGRHRNFYGIYGIRDIKGSLGHDDVRLLYHGTTIHGIQVLNRPRDPVSYYGPRSPVADALDLARRPRRAAILGLGAGVLLTRFEKGEDVTFYEIDPDNERIAREHFTFLADSAAAVRVVVGDARLTLEKQASDASLDVIVADAFSSDSVPIHLLTREAIDLYARKLKPDGVIAFNVSNRFLDLRPTLARVARTAGLACGFRIQPVLGKLDDGDYDFPSRWFAMSRDPARLEPLRAKGWTLGGETLPEASLWTDDRANALEPIWFELERSPK